MDNVFWIMCLFYACLCFCHTNPNFFSNTIMPDMFRASLMEWTEFFETAWPRADTRPRSPSLIHNLAHRFRFCPSIDCSKYSIINCIHCFHCIRCGYIMLYFLMRSCIMYPRRKHNTPLCSIV